MPNVAFSAVPLSSVLCILASGLLAVCLPLGLAIACCRRRRGALRAVLVGSLCFFVGAMVLESLCHQLVFSLFPALAQTPVLYALYGCLAAGIFEETARLIGLRRLCRQDSSAMTGFAYGVGHGGVESILVAGLGAVNNLAVITAINAGQADTILASVPAAQQAAVQAQLEQLATLPAVTFLASGVERTITLAFHIALSIVIWMVVTHRLPKWGYAAAVALHALVDSVAMMYQTGLIRSIWATEAILAAATAVVCWGVWRVYQARADASV